MARLTFSRKILNNWFQYLFDVRADSSCSVKTNDKNHSKKQNHSHGLMIVGRVKDHRWMGRHLNPRSVNTEKQEVAVLGNPNIHPVFVRSEMRDLRCFQQTTKVTLRGLYKVGTKESLLYKALKFYNSNLLHNKNEWGLVAMRNHDLPSSREKWMKKKITRL